ncbi:MAG: cell division protein FtsQ/DivIB [Rhodospirillales bacterium]
MKKKVDRKSRSTGAAGRKRKNPVPLWRRRYFHLTAAVVLAGVSSWTGWWVITSGAMARAADDTQVRFIAASADAGLRVDKILVSGRRQTTREELAAALNLDLGAPILAFDPAAARKRVESLDWIAEASVERMLPDTVLLRVKERRPLAIWQHQGRHALIDAEGSVILRDGLERFADLMIVVGEDAHQHARALIRMIEAEPNLRRHVTAAVRIGGRRWDIRLRNGVDIRLPEDKPGAAWSRLARFDAEHRLLDRQLSLIDLRIGDRVVIRGANGIESPLGQET